MGPMDIADSSEDEDEGDEVDRSDEQPIPKLQFMVSVPSTEDRQMDFQELQPVSVTNVPVVVGSALRKNEDGTVAAPIIRGKSKKVLSQRQLNNEILTLVIDHTWSREMEDLTPPSATSP